MFGVVRMTMKRMDGPVYLEPVTVEAIVVDDLSTVRAEVLIGSDLSAAAGGLHLEYDDDHELVCVHFGRERDATVFRVAAVQETPAKLSRHLSAASNGEQVTLEMDDFTVWWDETEKRWVLTWKWKDGQPPTRPVGPGIGKYARAQLSDAQEELFQKELHTWLENKWLVPYDEAVHGPLGAVLPLLPAVQQHKPSTPVRPCLDYSMLNEFILSNPGANSPVCGDKIREWRQRTDDSKLLDIRKAYLQVHLDESLQR